MSIASCIEDSGATYEVVHGTPEWLAALDWARFHGLDPNRIPAESTIFRDAANCRIVYDEFVPDGDSILIKDNEPVVVRRVEQGEAPPLPLPREITG